MVGRTGVRTDTHDAADSRFSPLCERARKSETSFISYSRFRITKDIRTEAYNTYPLHTSLRADTGGSASGLTQLGPADDHSSPSSFGAKNVWNYTPSSTKFRHGLPTN